MKFDVGQEARKLGIGKIAVDIVPDRYLAWLTAEEVELVQRHRDGESRSAGIGVTPNE